MDLGLKGRVAIVTGGSKGIGKATALALAREGVNVAICARGQEALLEVASEIRGTTGVTVVPVTADMTILDDIRTLVTTTIDKLGGVDILVNNAVNSVPALFLDLPDKAWYDHINVKVIGYVRCAREVIPHMIRRSGGNIVNIGGSAARSVYPLTFTNGATNAAVANFSKNLSDQVAKHQIRVNCIHPGATKTERMDRVLAQQAKEIGATQEEATRQQVESIPLGRMVEPEDIANAILFLVSDKAGAITGQSIAVDGGAARGIFY